MDTNPNSKRDSLLPEQASVPVIGASIPETTTEAVVKSLVSTVMQSSSSAAAAAASSSAPNSATIGSHNVASLRLAAGRSLSGPGPSSPSSTSSLSASFLNSASSATNRRQAVTPVKIQFLVLGAPGTGKTSLLRRLQNLNATSETTAGGTIGPDLHRLSCGTVEAIDIGGSDTLYPIAQAYCELFDVFLILFDVTSAESFLYARYWMEYLEQRNSRNQNIAGEGTEVQCKPQPSVLLIGNKTDLETAPGGMTPTTTPTTPASKQRRVSRNLARNLALTYGAEYREVSTRYDLTLSESILSILEKMVEQKEKATSS